MTTGFQEPLLSETPGNPRGNIRGGAAPGGNMGATCGSEVDSWLHVKQLYV